MSMWVLPTAITLSGIDHPINTDYRDILDIIHWINDPSENEQVRLYVALALFYEDFDSIPESDYYVALIEMMRFINCGEDVKNDKPQPKRIDWEQDHLMIAADINKVAGCEVRALPYLHWWTFLAYFNAIGEGQLSTVVSIREKRRKGKKLEDWERDYYLENKDIIDFKKNYTPEELKEIERLNHLLGG